MKKLHKSLISYQNFELEKGQRELLCSNKDLHRCPFSGFKTKEERVELVKPILKNLINFIIENEIKNYLDNLYAKQTRKTNCINI